MSPPKVLIAAAGTGGHIYPGIAVAQELQRLDGTVKIEFIGSPKGLEKKIVPQYGFPIHLLPAQKVKGMGVFSKFVFLVVAPWIAFRSLVYLLMNRPSICFGTGAYASAIPLRVAQLLGIPVVVHESNAKPGLTNRWVGKRAHSVFLNFQESSRFFNQSSCKLVGMPVRKTHQQVFQSILPPEARTATVRIAVLGGSQGAQKLNKSIARHAETLLKNTSLFILHQTGPKFFEEIRQLQSALPTEVQRRWLVVPYIENMSEVHAWASFFVCRAGASTLAELLVNSMPSILIPFPFAADNHQRANALSFEDAGGAQLIDESEMDKKLLPTIESFAKSPEKLLQMKKSLKTLHQQINHGLDPAKEIATELLRIAAQQI